MAAGTLILADAGFQETPRPKAVRGFPNAGFLDSMAFPFLAAAPRQNFFP
jgi:hypothetical protein